MHQFKDFNIQTTSKKFVGEKIRICKLLNQEIVVLDHKIVPAKHFCDKADKCLHLQISIKEEKRVLFTAAKGLIEAIEQIPETGFPFITTIIKSESDRYEFS